MTFQTEKNKQSSLKAYLVRLRPSRHINSYLTAIGGGRYSATVDLNITAIEEDSASLTRVSTTPNVGEYLFNDLTRELVIYPTNILNILIVHHYIFLTTARFRVVNEDPENSSTPLRDWEPRLESAPTIVQSISNIIEGLLSISVSSISIINSDNYFNRYLTVNDSFALKEIKIWQYINDISTIKMALQGTTGKELSSSGKNITISTTDILGEINREAFCGDNADEVYCSSNTLPNLNPDNEGDPIRLFFGRATKYGTIKTSVTNLPQARALDPEEMTTAPCIDFTETISTSTNRTWLLGRVISSYDFSDTPIVDNSDANFTRLTVSKEFFVGDTFIINQSATNYYARVFYFDRANSYAYINKIGAISTGAAILSNIAPSIVIDVGGDIYYPLYGRDYTASSSVTSGGNQQIKIVFVNNFEAALTMSTLDPTANQVAYRLRPNPLKHGDVIKYLLEKSGLSVNAASITSANSALNVNASFSIPYWDESDFDMYYSYIEKILASTLGFLRVNEDFEIDYRLFGTPAAGEIRTDIDIIRNSFSSRIDYNDLVTQIIAYNPHYNDIETVYESSATASSARAKYLHGLENVNRFVHCLDNIAARINAHINLKSERRSTSNLSTVSVDMDTLLGDNLTIKSEMLLGDSEKNGTIIDIQKTTGKTDITITDLYNL